MISKLLAFRKIPNLFQFLGGTTRDKRADKSERVGIEVGLEIIEVTNK